MAHPTHTELEFTTGQELAEFLAGLEYVRLPVRSRETYACHGFDDLGRPIVTFARRCYSEIGAPIRVQFVEVVKR